MRLPAPTEYERRVVAGRPAYVVLLLVFALHVSLGSYLQQTHLPFGIAYGELLFFAAIPWIATLAMGFRPKWFFALRWPKLGAWPWIALAACAGFVFAGGTNTLNRLLVGPELADRFDTTSIFLNRSWAERVALALGVTLLAPLGEELLFRGYLLRILGARYGALGGLLVTSALFALAHFNPAALIPLFALGCVFGLLRLVSGSLVPALAGHAIQNGVTAAVVLLGLTEEPQEEATLVPALALIAVSAPVALFALSRLRIASGQEPTQEPEGEETAAARIAGRDPEGARRGAGAHHLALGRVVPHVLAWLGVAVGSVIVLLALR